MREKMWVNLVHLGANMQYEAVDKLKAAKDWFEAQ